MHQNISNKNERFKRKMHLGISRVGVEKWIGYFDKKMTSVLKLYHSDIYTGEKVEYHNWTKSALNTFNVLSKRTDLGIILQIFEEK